MSSQQKPPTISDDVRAVDIYRRSARLIYEKGYRATSMADIAETVDLTKGGLYYYIKGKTALLYAIMSYALDRLEKDVVAPSRGDRDPLRRLARLVSSHVRLFVAEPHPLVVLYSVDEGELDERHRVVVHSRKAEYAGHLRDAIAALRPASELDPEIAAHSFQGMVHEVVRSQLDTSLAGTAALAEQVTGMALHGLIPR